MSPMSCSRPVPPASHDSTVLPKPLMSSVKPLPIERFGPSLGSFTAIEWTSARFWAPRNSRGARVAWEFTPMISRTANRPRYRYAIVAIVKNERPYLAEWIAYHRLIGFEHFYIADHGSTDDSDLLLAKWQRQGLVTARRWEQEERAQVMWYQHVLEQHGHEATYLAFLDVDEFLVHPHCDRPLDWLEPTLAPEDVGAVAINWRIFGSSGMRFRQPGGVLERFTMASDSERVVNCHVKSIVKPSRVLSMTAHTAELKPGCRYLGADGQAATFLDGKTKSGRTERVIDTPMRVYHYNIKSQEEFVDTKMTRGRANMGPTHSRDLEYFHKHDMNEVKLGFSPELLGRVDDAARELAPELAAPPVSRVSSCIFPKRQGPAFDSGPRRISETLRSGTTTARPSARRRRWWRAGPTNVAICGDSGRSSPPRM
ncbi:hypothetical protein CUR86_11085 [Salinicola acroporae]|uniref:Glycosyltransferase family 2 protein n=1 Tax=Salinicola acroporae TaxID=1541440 RepID=A0ABT6I5G7_9GAMM|nr:hypothetical protein [Salinicola acroporae]